MANRRIDTTELDFDAIKQSLKSYLQGQQQFSDYDFEGSGLSVLLDVLAYNTHYNALYTNLAVNEAFIDSASKRSSVVSKAKELGYTPKSSQAATAVVNVTMINNQVTAPTTIEIPAFSQFTSQVDGQTYTFFNPSTAIAQRVGNQYLFQNVQIKEGSFLSFTYVYSNTGTQIIIPNTAVDRSTIRVAVQVNAQSTDTTIFNESTTVLDLSPTSPVYFLKELDNQTYELEFGNDIVGKALEPGNVVTVTYLVCAEDRPNGANAFTYIGVTPPNTTTFVSTISVAVGGAGPEDIESIRWNAPRSFTAQNRCVTVEDYKTIINSMYSEARSVSVWGGEDTSPPQYGKVFISIVPNSLGTLSQAEKDYILNDIIKPRKPLSITPEIVDPTFIHIEMSITFYYNPQLTTRSLTDIQSLVLETVRDYNDTYLNEFDGIFKFSKLSSLVDSTENSIVSNIMTIKLHRELDPIYNVAAEYFVELGNPIYDSGVPEESILSNGFIPVDTTNMCYIDDIPLGNGTGTLRMFYYSADNQKQFVKNVGTVNYATGIIDITDLNITSLEEPNFELVIKPQSNDVVGNHNQFVTIDEPRLTINAVAESAYKPYTFTSSRT